MRRKARWRTPCWRRLPCRGPDPRSDVQRVPGQPARLDANAGEILEIASVLVEVGEHHLAYAMLGLVDQEHPDNAGLLIDLARLYSTLEDQPRALSCIERARGRGATIPLMRHMQGIVRSFVGQLDAAVASSEESLAKAPFYGHAHWSRAQLGRKDGARERVARMRLAQATRTSDNDDITYLHYGLFKELDTLGQTEEAWASLMAGAQARRSVTSTTPHRKRPLTTG